MIYFDNAATTKYKPEAVYEATNFYLREVGVSPGRGSYGMGIEASRMLYKSRCAVGKYFGMSRPDKVLFTKNSTEAMNLFFNGFLHQFCICRVDIGKCQASVCSNGTEDPDRTSIQIL